MAGKENQGIESAEAGLFEGKAYCICPAVDAPESALKTVLGMVQLIGSEPVFIDPDEHDVYAAAVSHLPILISTALFQLLRASPSWPDMSVMASSGFRDATRLASGDPRMSHDIWVTNREALIHWLDRMAGELQRFRSLLEDARDDELLEVFAGARVDRDAFIVGTPTRTPDTANAAANAETRGVIMDMMIGGMLGDKIRKMQDITENPVSSKASAPEKPKADASKEPPPKKRRPSLAERIEADVRRDLERGAGKEASEQNPLDGA